MGKHEVHAREGLLLLDGGYKYLTNGLRAALDGIEPDKIEALSAEVSEVILPLVLMIRETIKMLNGE